MANVEATQRRDHRDAEMINKYTQLADRKMATEAESRALKAELAALRASSPQPQIQDSKARVSTPTKKPASPGPSEPSVATAQLRQQLADAQKARSLLEAEVAKIPGLQSSNASQVRQLNTLEKEILSLKRKLRDQEEEIREKQKLAAQVQDEMISLNLQLSMAEQQTEKLEKDNRELVNRWMREMGNRAETMNKGSGW